MWLGRGFGGADARLKARMRLISFAFPTYIALCIGFGWCLEAKVNIAGPLIFLFFSAYFAFTSFACWLTIF